MMEFRRWTVASAVFAILLTLSSYGFYYFNGIPSTRSKNTIDLQYTQTAEYRYTALVTFKPIIHHGDVFHVLDGDVRYEFHMAAEGDVEEK